VSAKGPSRRRSSNLQKHRQRKLRTVAQWIGVAVLVAIFAVLWKLSRE
jgi:predicted nucleic acid-binding Zn ribbon protein